MVYNLVRVVASQIVDSDKFCVVNCPFKSCAFYCSQTQKLTHKTYNAYTNNAISPRPIRGSSIISMALVPGIFDLT